MDMFCKDCSAAFLIEEEDKGFYQKMDLPYPTCCPDCRQQRRLAFRNERHLHKRKCDLCHQDVISIYHQSSENTVYCPQCWWSDKWDALSFGCDFDFNRPFFKQFYELKQQVPHMALHVVNNENSDYVNMTGYCKNCYLIFASDYCEDCAYGVQVIKSQGCFDTFNCTESQYCFDVIDVNKCYELFYSMNCSNCKESMFLFDCKNCSNCLFSSNLRGKQYYIFNKKCSKEEYEIKRDKIFEDLNSGKLDELMQEYLSVYKSAFYQNLQTLNNEKSFGDFLFNSKKAKYCFDLSYAEDSRFVFTGFEVKDLMDVCHTTKAELAYEATSIGFDSYNVAFANGAWSTKNSRYVDNVHFSSDVFGCVGLSRAKFCILNKQYSQEEYQNMISKITDSMKLSKEFGEFFPKHMSPFAYNETLAQDYYPLTKEQVLDQGLKWRDVDAREYSNQTCDVPLNIKEVAHSILDEILACQECKKNYKIMKQELAFYKRMGLPIPKYCFNCRHLKRMKLRNPRKFWDSDCCRCHKSVKTTFSPEYAAKVHCEKCYLDEIT